MPTTYFAGSKDQDFTIAGTVTTTTTAGPFRSTYVSQGLVISLGSTLDPPANRITSPAFTPNSSMWIHGSFATPAAVNATTANATLFRALDGGVARIVVRGTGTAGQWKVDKRDAAGTFTNLCTSLAGAAGSGGNAQNFDLFIQYGTSGLVQLYIGGALAATSGIMDVTTNGATTLNQVEFSGVNTANTMTWSECIVSDSLTINAGTYQLKPAASGNTQNFAPNTVANVSKNSVADSTFVSTANNNDLSQWTTPVAPPAGFVVQAIVLTARVAAGLTGPQHFDWLLRTKDGTDHLAGTSNAPTTSLANFSGYVWSTNPATMVGWVPSDIAVGFNIGIKALA